MPENAEKSVHFTLLPVAEKQFIDEVVERRVTAMRSVIEIVRTLRERKGISVKVNIIEQLRIFFDHFLQL